jgi:hypothetical protein
MSLHFNEGPAWLGPLPHPSVPPADSSLSEFTCFPRLPLELRCEIWKATLSPRVIEINYDLPDGFFASASSPIALQICRESRNIVLPHYPLCFGTIFHPAKTRFNFALDTLYIDNTFEEDVPHLFSALNSIELERLKYVAIDSYYNSANEEGEFEFIAHLRRAMRCLKGLKELQILFDVQILTERTLGCGQEDHPMEIFETLPVELTHPELKIGALPSDLELEEFDLWKVKAVKPVYGWRRCPMGVDMNEQIYDTYESDIWRTMGPLAPFMWDADDTDMDLGDSNREEEEEEEEEDEEEVDFDEDEEEDHFLPRTSSGLSSTFSLD